MTKQYSADLASLCANLSGEDIPPAVRERVRYLLLDDLAVTLRGSLLPSSLATYQMLYTVHGIKAEEVTISGRHERAEAAWAGLYPASAYERGFHPTDVCGTLGAATAIARPWIC
jgi:2-methylcitrate dehydratase PrpD